MTPGWSAWAPTRLVSAALFGALSALATFGADAPSAAPQPALPAVKIVPVAPAAKPAPAAAAATDSLPSYSKFQYIADWNIFNVARVGRGAPEQAPPPTETVTMAGTIEYEKGVFALFNGSNHDNQKAAKVGETIAGFTIQSITPQGVDLVREGKHLALATGQQMTKRVGGDWEAGAMVSSAAGTYAPSTTAAPGESQDILKRLIEKRQQQLKQ